MTTYLTITGVELREAGGEDFSTIVKGGTLTVKGSPAVIEVDGNRINLERSSREPFKRIGRDFKFATGDIMSFYYVSLPVGLQDSVYDRFEELLTLMQAGKPLTLPKPAAAAAAAAPAAAPAPAAAAAKEAVSAAADAAKEAVSAAADAAKEAAAPVAAAGKNFFDQLKEMGAKAAEDTMTMAAAIKAKAEHDMAAFQEQQAAKAPEGGPA